MGPTSKVAPRWLNLARDHPRNLVRYSHSVRSVRSRYGFAVGDHAKYKRRVGDAQAKRRKLTEQALGGWPGHHLLLDDRGRSQRLCYLCPRVDGKNHGPLTAEELS